MSNNQEEEKWFNKEQRNVGVFPFVHYFDLQFSKFEKQWE